MGLIKHLPVRMLKKRAITKKRKFSSIGNNIKRVEADDEAIDDNPTAQPIQWTKKNQSLIGSKIAPYKKPELTAEDKEILDSASSALDFYLLYSTPEYIKRIIHQSRLYAVQKGFFSQMAHLHEDTFRCTEAVMLHSGYNQVPRRKMLWEKNPDCHNQLVADNVRRLEVDAVLQCLHFRDNCTIDDDGYYKVRPIFDNLNRCAKYSTHLSENGRYSVDEMMIPYYGRHSSKQYIRGKPVRYGFKVIFKYN